MKKYRMVLLLMVLGAFVYGLFGPPLAREGQDPGKLVGSFLTVQGPDSFFPEEDLMNENVDRKLYGIIRKRKGKIEYSFPQMEGQWALELYDPKEESISYLSSEGARVSSHVEETDFGRENKLEKQVYILGGEKRTYYSYPIYKTEKGKVYVKLSASGMNVEGDTVLEESFSISHREEREDIKNGKKKSSAIRIIDKVTFLDPIEGTRVLYFDRDHRLIKADWIKVERGGTLSPSKETEYIIVERVSKDTMVREVHSRGEESFLAFVQDGIYFNRVDINLNWES